MNNRQLNLHNIIKQQQSKICQLKQELSMVAKITQSSFIDSQKRNIELIVEKDEIIVHLKKQLDHERNKNIQHDKITKLNHQLKLQKDQYEIEYRKAKQTTTTLQKRIHQLQYNLQSIVEQYQQKLTHLHKQNHHLSTQLQSLTNTFNLTQQQIDKLTKFYKSSHFDIPKRKETLLWVDNLIKFMEVSQVAGEKKYAELVKVVEGGFQDMWKEVMKAVSQVAVVEEGLTKDGEKIIGEMRQLCDEIKSKQLQITSAIDQLIKTGKLQKQTLQKAQLSHLKSHLETLQQQSHLTSQSLKSRIKQLQTEKKTLVLGFQQVKTFLQNKQTTYKQQIHSLKQTINQLLEANQLRELEFQEEIKLLSSQIQSISTRYYENIQYPVMKVNQKVQKELNKVKQQLINLAEENSFRTELITLTDRLKKYSDAIGEEDKQFQAIQLCMKKGNQLLITIRQLLVEMGEKRGERRSVSRMRNNQSNSQQNHNNNSMTYNNQHQKPIGTLSTQSKHPKQPPVTTIKQPSITGPPSLPRHPTNQISFNQSNVLPTPNYYQFSQIQQLNQLQSVVSQIHLKQRENKITYQTSLLKKHNQKLTDHLTALEKKFRQLAGNKLAEDSKSLVGYFVTERKLIQVVAELQQARETNVMYQKLLKEQLQKVVRKLQQFRKQSQTANKQQSAILDSLNQLNQRHNLIHQMLSTRNQRITQLQHSVTTINNILIKPSQTFENLVKQFTSHLSSLTLTYNQHSSRLYPQNQQQSTVHHNNQPSYYRSRLSINESTIKEYQQILARRNQINSNGSRLIVELIKTLRETFPVRDNKKRQEISGLGEKENLSLMKGQQQSQSKGNKSKPSPSSTIDKKIKQIITTQQKHKQQITLKIDKILQSLSTLQTKRDKQTKLSSTKQKKIQQLLEKYIPSAISQIKTLVDRENKQYGVINVEALRDTASKLRQSIRENQGLKREMDAILALAKGNVLKQDNFYQQV